MVFRTTIFVGLFLLQCMSFTPNVHRSTKVNAPPRFATKQSRTTDTTQSQALEDEEAPAGIGGAEFFGGNKQKEELYDPEAEAKAGADDVPSEDTYNRFLDTGAFSDELASKVAASLQSQINDVLYAGVPKPNSDFTYASNMSWDAPRSLNSKNSQTPLRALTECLEFYKQVDVAIVAGKKISESTIQLQWEISVVWPIFWEARVLLTGSSTLTIDGSSIMKQSDELSDAKDVLSAISPQLPPRFWDFYHIGMTPSAELMPRLSEKQGFLSDFSVYEIPGRLVTSPTQLDVGDRDDRNAQTVPNHAFGCVIKTMGPTRQRYVPTSPVQVQIIPGGERLKLKWSIPLSVEFQSNPQLPLPGQDPEALPGSMPECGYEFQPRRKVATVKYGGDPQDVEITEIRKNLYGKVVKDGLKPKLDENGRPQFFFFQNTVKACYTEEGLGMCVYEWRPEAVKPNEVGIELEL